MVDHLSLHVEARNLADWSLKADIEFLHPTNAHNNYVDQIDETRDQARAAALREALSIVRERVKHPADELNWEFLQALQGKIVGRTMGFRDGVAFAKGGAERYDLLPDAQQQFESCLRETRDTSMHPLSLAVRAYLDVQFFHPFADGNARCARMVFEYVVASANIGFKDLRPIFAPSRNAGDVQGYQRLLRTAVTLASKPMKPY